MKKSIILILMFISINIQADSVKFVSAYQGIVGSSIIDATLTFYTSGKVNGSYTSRKTGKVYVLKGNNHTNGELYFREYTRGKNTAMVGLIKGRYEGRVAWVGIMKNFDGRQNKMALLKK